MIVVDVNVIAYLLIEGSKTALARQVYERDSHWVAPALWRSEFLNILALQLHYRGFTLAAALELWTTATTLLAEGQREVDMPLALRLAAENRISAYDAQYLALAEKMSLVCVSEDRELARKFPARTTSMSGFLKQP